MTLEDINYIAQTIAAFGVIGSLIYLAIQTRHATEQTRRNTQTLKAAAGFEATHSWADFNESILSFSEEKLALALAPYNPGKSRDDFSDIDFAWLALMNRSLFQKLEGQYFLFKYGNLEKTLWEKRRDWAGGLIKLPFFQHWWQFEKSQNIWTDEFVAAIETARDTTAVIPWKPVSDSAPNVQKAAAEPLGETSAP